MYLLRFKSIFQMQSKNEPNLKPIIEKIENFAKFNLLIIHSSSDDNVFRHKSFSRILWVLMTRIVIFLSILRFGLTVIISTESMRTVLFNFFYLMGDSKLISSAITLVLVSQLTIEITAIYQERIHNFALLRILYMLKYKLIKYPLSANNYRKLCARLNILSKYSLFVFNTLLVVFLNIIHLIMTLIMYSTLEKTFVTTLTLIVSNVLAFINITQIFALLWTAFCLFFLGSVYLKMKFTEINDRIAKSIEQKDIKLLMYSIAEHNYVEKLTQDFNKYFSICIFILYYFETIGFLIGFFGIHKSDTTFIGRIILGVIVSTCFTAIIALNLMCTWVVTAAHKPYSSLITIINKRILMTVGQRIKLLSFIEKLSGREIGFYCYDLFPMNNYEFYQYLYIAGCNYFLLMDLF